MLSESIKDNRQKYKKVTFSKKVQVILIPTSTEYIQADLSKNLWYDKNDLESFLNSFKKFKEIQSIFKN